MLESVEILSVGAVPVVEASFAQLSLVAAGLFPLVAAEALAWEELVWRLAG